MQENMVAVVTARVTPMFRGVHVRPKGPGLVRPMRMTVAARQKESCIQGARWKTSMVPRQNRENRVAST